MEEFVRVVVRVRNICSAGYLSLDPYLDKLPKQNIIQVLQSFP